MSAGLARVGAALLATLGAHSLHAAPAQAPSGGLFRHTDHVRSTWLQADLDRTEYARDCRGCHDYSSPDPALRPSPRESCERCHGHQGPRIEGTTAVDPRAESGALGASASERFNHHEHRALQCFECHLVPGATEVPAVMPVTKPLGSAAACAGCHGPGGRAADKHAQFLAGLDARLARRGARDFGVFRHDQHLKAEELRNQDPAACQQCHAEVEDADARTLGKKQFSLERCERCHEGARFGVETREKDSRTAATFLHKKHLSPAARSMVPELGEKGCFACHAYDPARATFDLGPRFPAGDAYRGCVTCHREWEVEGHGSVDDCKKCHDLDGGAFVEIWHDRRAKESVARPPAATFEVGAQVHPFIAGDAAADEDCGSCHRARIPALPSRVSGRPFSHATHLSGEPKDDHLRCRSCHAGMSEASGPADIVFPPSVASGPPLYELEHCRDCHRSPSIAVVPGGASVTRSVPRFSHAEHLSRTHPVRGGALTCLDCHAPAGARVALKPDVAACTECHGHATHPETTGRYDQRMVDACRQCHFRGVPARAEAVAVERLALTSPTGKRTHPRAPDCAECHEPAPADPAPERRHELRIAGKQFATPHQSGREDRYFEQSRVGSRTTWCIDCHWANWKAIAASKAQLEKQEWYRQFPEEHRWRREYGPRLDEGYPGIPWPAAAR
jgi:hypothetical protein